MSAISRTLALKPNSTRSTTPQSLGSFARSLTRAFTNFNSPPDSYLNSSSMSRWPVPVLASSRSPSLSPSPIRGRDLGLWLRRRSGRSGPRWALDVRREPCLGKAFAQEPHDVVSRRGHLEIPVSDQGRHGVVQHRPGVVVFIAIIRAFGSVHGRLFQFLGPSGQICFPSKSASRILLP